MNQLDDAGGLGPFDLDIIKSAHDASRIRPTTLNRRPAEARRAYLSVVGGGGRVRPNGVGPVLPLPLDDDARGRVHAHDMLVRRQSNAETPHVVRNLLDLSQGELAELLCVSTSGLVRAEGKRGAVLVSVRMCGELLSFLRFGSVRIVTKHRETVAVTLSVVTWQRVRGSWSTENRRVELDDIVMGAWMAVAKTGKSRKHSAENFERFGCARGMSTQ